MVIIFISIHQVPAGAKSYGQTGVKLTTSTYNLDLSPLRSPRMSVTRVTVLHPYTKFDVSNLVGQPVRKAWLIFGHDNNQPDDLDL